MTTAGISKQPGSAWSLAMNSAASPSPVSPATATRSGRRSRQNSSAPAGERKVLASVPSASELANLSRILRLVTLLSTMTNRGDDTKNDPDGKLRQAATLYSPVEVPQIRPPGLVDRRKNHQQLQHIVPVTKDRLKGLA